MQVIELQICRFELAKKKPNFVKSSALSAPLEGGGIHQASRADVPFAVLLAKAQLCGQPACTCCTGTRCAFGWLACALAHLRWMSAAGL